MEQVFSAIKKQDAPEIKALFSEKAIREAANIDEQTVELLSFIKGNPVSWSRDGSPRTYDSSEDGGYLKRQLTWFYLETDEQTYSVLLVDYPEDTIDIDNVGLYTIKIILTEDESKLDGYIEDWIVPGIHIGVT